MPRYIGAPTNRYIGHHHHHGFSRAIPLNALPIESGRFARNVRLTESWIAGLSTERVLVAIRNFICVKCSGLVEIFVIA